MSGLIYTIAMVDALSRPANAAASATNQLRGSLAAAKIELSGFQSQAARSKDIFGEASRQHLDYAGKVYTSRRRVYDLQQQLESLGPVASQSGASLLSTIRPYALGLAVVNEAGWKVVHTLESLAVATLRAANAEQVFERQSIATFSALGGSEETGRATFSLLDGLSRRLPIARAQLADWTRELQAAGITDVGVLRSGLTGLASSEALVGAGGPEKLLETIRKIQGAIETGRGLKLDPNRGVAGLAKAGVDIVTVAKFYDQGRLSAAQLSAQLKAGTADAGKFGTALFEALNARGKVPLQAMFLDLDILKAKGIELGEKLYRNIDLKPLSDATRNFINLLDQATPSGRAIEAGVRGGVNGAIRAFAELTNATTVAFLKLEIAAYKVAIAFYPVYHTVRKIYDLLGSSPVKLAIDTLTLGSSPINDVSHIADILLGATGRSSKETKADDSSESYRARLRTATAGIALAATNGATREQLIAAGQKLTDFIIEGVNQSFITHEEGVAARAAALGRLIPKSMADGAEVKSPSRATMRIGAHVARGAVLGMQSGYHDVSRAAFDIGERISDIPTWPSRDFSHLGASVRERRGDPGSRAGGGGGKSIQIGSIVAHFTAPQGVTDATAITAHGLAITLERFALMDGA